MLTSISFEELLTSAGRDLGQTGWHTITQPEVDQFAELTQDRQWIHIDVARARTGPFGSTVVHGFLTLSLLPFFIDQLLKVTGISMGVNYGLDKVRFPAAVPTGSQVRGGVVIAAVDTSKPGRAATTLRVTVDCDAAKRPACVADLVAMFFR